MSIMSRGYIFLITAVTLAYLLLLVLGNTGFVWLSSAKKDISKLRASCI